MPFASIQSQASRANGQLGRNPKKRVESGVSCAGIPTSAEILISNKLL